MVISFLLHVLAGTTLSNEFVGVEAAVGTDFDVGVTVSTVPSGPLPSSSSASVLLSNSSTRCDSGPLQLLLSFSCSFF